MVRVASAPLRDNGHTRPFWQRIGPAIGDRQGNEDCRGSRRGRSSFFPLWLWTGIGAFGNQRYGFGRACGARFGRRTDGAGLYQQPVRLWSDRRQGPL